MRRKRQAKPKCSHLRGFLLSGCWKKWLCGFPKPKPCRLLRVAASGVVGEGSPGSGSLRHAGTSGVEIPLQDPVKT